MGAVMLVFICTYLRTDGSIENIAHCKHEAFYCDSQGHSVKVKVILLYVSGWVL